jgi:RND family efflux transporter MFP subunit
MSKSPQAQDLSRLTIENKEFNRSSGSNARTKFLLFIAATAVLLSIVFLRRTSEQKENTNTGPESVQESRPTSQLAPRTAELDATGYVVAQRKAAVSSKATGRLKELRVREGDAVTEGQVIGVIENEDLEAVLVQEQAGLKSAEARVQSAQAEYDDASLNRRRAADLLKKSVIAQSEMDSADARQRKAAAALEVARADVQLAKARIEKAQVDFDFTLIKAPFAGTVLTKDADVGEIVAPFGSSTNARAALVTIADMDSLQVEADVSEANIAKIRLGQQCRITLDSYPEKHYRGVVDSIVPTVDRAKATVQVKIRFLDKDARVIPEMSAKVAFDLRDADHASQPHTQETEKVSQ